MPKDRIDPASGLGQLRAIQAGDAPAPSGLTHFPTELLTLEPGDVTLQSEPPPGFGNPKGDVHGGFAAVVLLNALAAAVQSCMNKDQGFITLEMKVNFGKAVRPESGPLTTRGRIVQLGRKTAIAEARMLDPSEQFMGSATATFLVIGSAA